VTDMEEFFDRIKAVEPYLQASTPPTDFEYDQSVADRRSSTTRSIASCAAAARILPVFLV